ncbi:MAG TPA: hypothetical protein VN947_08195 [Polyangia bacterium]|nr:hypothetical protein [Polyangia bacterium]
MTDLQDDEIALDPEVEGVTVALRPLSEAPPPAPPLPPADGFRDDEWAVHLPDGQILAFLREPVAHCHLDRIALVAGARRVERPLPGWVYYPSHFAVGQRGLLIGGPRSGWRLDYDGTLTLLLDEPDGEGVNVAWRGDTAVLAGWRRTVLDGPGGRVELPCANAVAACAVAGLAVISDDDGSMWIEGDRVIARHWRPYREARGDDVILSTAGDAYAVRVIRG